MENKKYTPLFIRKFIDYFIIMRNIREAALKAGSDIESAEYDGSELLKRKSVSDRIKKYDKKLSDDTLAVSGLRRLATGNICDAVKLAFCEKELSDKEISKLDLFNVSEIKKDKGGGVEIKFFDRQKAFEKIWEINNSSNNNCSADSFLKALCESKEDDEKDDTV